MSVETLRAADVQAFEAIGVGVQILAAARVRRVSHHEAREICGLRYKSEHLEGLAFPYINPSDGATVGWRVRRDHPEVESNGTPIAKYVSSPDRRHLYFAPGAFELLPDTTSPVIIVEAEKSVLAIAAARLRSNRTPSPLIVATGGCWGWRGVTGKVMSANGVRVDEKGAIPDLDRIAWTDRQVTILFDSNTATNEKVQAARRALASELTARGAKVQFAELRIEDGVNGPDDYIGKYGDAALFALFDAAKPFTTKPAKRGKAEKAKQGQDLHLDDPEPWPEAVDGAALLNAIATLLRTFVVFGDPKYADALALWILHTYAMDLWFISPLAVVNSPTMQCGKTTLLQIVAHLVSRALATSNITPAALFRAVEKYRPTLILDEAETFLKDNDELRGLVNAGHTRKTAIVIRTVGESHDPAAFSTWCAKFLALIGRLPGTLMDRAIVIPMRRRLAGERVERLRLDQLERRCLPLQRQAVRWVADQTGALSQTDPDMPPALRDRPADNWRTLVAIADVAGGDWPLRSRAAATLLAPERGEDDASATLLADIREAFKAEGNPEVIASAAIVDRLVALDDRPWAEWSHGRPLSTAKLARMLATYGVHPAGTIRIGSKTAKGYRYAAFDDAWTRYLPVEESFEASHGNAANASGLKQALSKRHSENERDGLQNVTSPMNTERNDVVTDGSDGMSDVNDRRAEYEGGDDACLF